MYGHPVALIDLGSNTVRLVVYALGEERALKERVKGAEKIGEEKCFLGLWSERKGSELSEKGFRDLVAVLCQQDQYARRMGCGKILCFATASLRGLSHRVTEALEAETGLRIWQMEEKEEIFCDCKSLQLFLPEQVSKGLGCDIGGGSGQIFLYEENGPQQGVSLPIGVPSAGRGMVSGRTLFSGTTG